MSGYFFIVIMVLFGILTVMNWVKTLSLSGVAVAALLITSVAHAPAASAAGPGFNFNVSPPSVAVETIPGAPITVDIRIQNEGTTAENLTTKLMKFTPQGESGVPDLRNIAAGDDFANWAVISPTSFTAQPNEWTTVHLTITPPKTAAFGYYYAVQFSRADTSKLAEKGKSNVIGAVASLVLLDVKAPGAIRKVNVTEFSTKTKVMEFLPVDFNVRLNNIGNTHVGVRGNIAISKNGKQVGQVEVNSSKGYILPKSFRNFTTSWSDGTPVYLTQKDAIGKAVLDNNGVPVRKLSYDNFGLSKLRFGKYNARLVMIYNDGKGDVSTEARLTFWVIPWRIIVPIVFLIILVLAGAWALFIRPASRSLKKKKPTYEDRSH